jgi:hypothetical protein
MNHLFNFERLLIRFQQQPPWPRGPGEFVYGRRIAAYGHHRTLLTGEDGRQLFQSAKTSVGQYRDSSDENVGLIETPNDSSWTVLEAPAPAGGSSEAVS